MMIRSRGFIAVEMLFGLVALALMTTMGIELMAKRMDSQNYQIAAQQQQQVADAAAKYLKDNFTAVSASAGATTPAQITVAMLRNTNYLPTGFADTNVFGQTFVVLARKPAANQLESLVLTQGGQTLDEIGARELAQNLGAPGGFIANDATGVVQGIRGGWQVALSNYGTSPGAGHVASALFLQDGTLANDYLYRNAMPNHPELNRMNTALDMGTQDIVNAGAITAAKDIKTTGDIYGKNITASAKLTADNAEITNDARIGGWIRTKENGGWYSEKWGGGWYMSDSNFVRAYGDKSVYTAGQIRGGTLASDGRTQVGEYLLLGQAATEGASCQTSGLLARDAAGFSLACQNGVWVRPVRWYNQAVSAGGTCTSTGGGSLAFDAQRVLYVCK